MSQSLQEGVSPTRASTILIDGATGYLGSHLASKLLSDGHDVLCLVHGKARDTDVAFLQSLGATVVRGDLVDDAGELERLKESFSGVDCAVHLIGSIAPRKGETFSELHESMAGRFARLCSTSGVRKIVMVTALGSDSSAQSEYHRSKWAAEQRIIASGLAYTILRPSLLVGRQVGRRDSKLVQRLRTFVSEKPFVPLINGGRGKLQPLFIGDMVEAIARCVGTAHDGAILELGGPEVVTMRELVGKLQRASGRSKPIVSLAPGVGRMMAKVMESVQDVPTLSNDQVTLSMSDNICRINGLPTVLSRELTSVDAALRSYQTATAAGQGRNVEPAGSREVG